MQLEDGLIRVEELNKRTGWSRRQPRSGRWFQKPEAGGQGGQGGGRGNPQRRKRSRRQRTWPIRDSKVRPPTTPVAAASNSSSNSITISSNSSTSRSISSSNATSSSSSSSSSSTSTSTSITSGISDSSPRSTPGKGGPSRACFRYGQPGYFLSLYRAVPPVLPPNTPPPQMHTRVPMTSTLITGLLRESTALRLVADLYCRYIKLAPAPLNTHGPPAFPESSWCSVTDHATLAQFAPPGKSSAQSAGVRQNVI